MLGQAPHDFRAMYGLGITLQRLGRLDEAEKWLTATLAANPGFDRATKRLSELRAARTQRPSPASQGQRQAHPSVPDRPLQQLMVPQDEAELARYKKWSREKARIDKANDQWYGLPVWVRVVQVLIGVAVLIGLIYGLVSYLNH
jgi:hypothetical protein